MGPRIETDQGAERGHVLPKVKVLVRQDLRPLVCYRHILEQLIRSNVLSLVTVPWWSNRAIMFLS